MHYQAATIVTALHPAEFLSAKALFTEYQQFLGVDLCFQSFDTELNQLDTMYSSPDGALLLAVAEDNYAGCVAIRKKSDGICEMKRLYVKELYKGKGIGRMLVNQIILEAKHLGYQKIILDTLDRLKPALSLYETLGFKPTSAYYHNPLTGVIFLEKAI